MRRLLFAVFIFGGTATPSRAQLPPPAQPAPLPPLVPQAPAVPERFSTLPLSLAPQTPATQPAQPGADLGAQLPAPPTSGMDADPSVQFPSSFLQPPPAASLGQPLSTPFDWNHFRLGGQYRIEGDGNNFGFHPLTLPASQPSQAFVSQRFRLWLTYTPTEHVEGYIQMQVGGINWGTNGDFEKNFAGTDPSIVGDRVGIQLRRAWLAYKDEDLGKLRAGFLDWHDSFNDTLASSNYDFNIGGLDWVKTVSSLNDLRVSAAALLLSDLAYASTDPAPTGGTHTATLLAADVDQPLTSKLSVGGSTYVIYDRGGYSYPTAGPYRYALDAWYGARAKWANDVLPLSGFVILNTGRRDNIDTIGYRHTGWAGWIEAGALKIGDAKLSSQFIYSNGSSNTSTGKSDEFRTVAQSYRDNFGSQGYWSYMQLTSPNGPGDVADLGVGLQDRGLGLITLQGKLEYPLTKKLTSTSTAGWLQSAAKNPTSDARGIGTEIGQMFTYDFGGGLKLDTGTAILFTGDYYRPAPGAAKADTLWETFARLQLEF